MARRTLIWTPVLLSLALAGAALAAEAPMAVSPGDASKLVLVEGRCPTFNWSAVDEATGYEILVYRLGGEGEEAEPVLNQRIAGSALGWTPSLDRCLERGRRYAWSVRAVGRKKESEWSPPSLFQLARGPSETEFKEALRVVQDYLSMPGSSHIATRQPRVERVVAEKPDESSKASTAGASKNPRPEPTASVVALPPELVVDGSAYLSSGLGIGNPSPAFPLSIQADQAVADLESTFSVNGSVLVLRNTFETPFFLGAINFNDATDTAVGQIAYQGLDNTMTFRTNNAEQMRITSTGDVTNNVDRNGLVKAWAKVLMDGTVQYCYNCNERDAATNRISLGVYEIDFSPSGVDAEERPVLCTARVALNHATMRCAGDSLGTVHVDTFNNGNSSDAGFYVAVF